MVELTMEEWYEQKAFDKKDVMGIVSMLHQARMDIRYRRFADAEAIVVDLEETCKTRLWPGSVLAHLPSATMAYPNILCPAAINEDLALSPVTVSEEQDSKLFTFLKKLKSRLLN